MLCALLANQAVCTAADCPQQIMPPCCGQYPAGGLRPGCLEALCGRAAATTRNLGGWMGMVSGCLEDCSRTVRRSGGCTRQSAGRRWPKARRQIFSPLLAGQVKGHGSRRACACTGGGRGAAQASPAICRVEGWAR